MTAELVPVDRAQPSAVEVVGAADPWERWLAPYSAATKTTYRRVLTQYLDWCAGRQLDVFAVRPGDVNAWVADMQAAGLVGSTVVRNLSVVSSYYDWAEDEGLTSGRHMPKRRPSRSDPPVILGIGPDEARAVLAAVGAPDEDDRRASAFTRRRLRTLVMLLMFCGLRVSEALGADVDQLGTERGHRVLHVLGKGRKKRRVVLPPATAHAIDVLLDGRESGPIFTTTRGGRWDRRDAHRAIARLGRSVALKLWPHLLRHTHVTLALESGRAIEEVAADVGHADINTTRRYAQGRARLDRASSYAVAGLIGED